MNLSKKLLKKKLFSRVQWFENIRTCFLWFFIFTSLSISNQSCSTKESGFNHQLVYSKTVDFQLDNESGAFPSFARIDQFGGKEIFGFFNSGNNRLYLYDAETRKLKAKLSFEAEGPDGIGSSRIIGYQYISSDSIFIFTYNLMKLFHVDTSGKIHRYYPVRGRNDNVDLGFPDISTNKPLRVIDGKAYIASLSVGQEPHADHRKVTSVFIVDLKTGKVNVSMNRPPLYNEGFWGPIMKYQVFSCFNLKTRRFVYSFGADHFIYETDHHKFFQKHYAPYDRFPKKIEPLNKDKYSGLTINREEQRQYDRLSPSYFAILHDPYRKVYYRFATLPQSLEEFKNNVSQHPAVVILDENFKKIGQSILPKDKGLQFHTMMVGKDGLYINQVPFEENKMVFAIYALTSKSN